MQDKGEAAGFVVLGVLGIIVLAIPFQVMFSLLASWVILLRKVLCNCGLFQEAVGGAGPPHISHQRILGEPRPWV